MKSLKERVKIRHIVSTLRRQSKKWATTAVMQVAQADRDPFKVLVSTVLSARTKDETTRAASGRLLQLADNPQAMRRLRLAAIEKAIYPVGFYRTKARNLRALCHTLLDRFHGRVPETLEELMTLKGVGRKTANLVVTLAFGKLGICVDTHVHRISNRLGLVRTKNPKETEFALRRVLPTTYWIEYNDLLVSFGQNLCRPISPFCSLCPIEKDCPQIGVTRHR